MSTFKKTAKWTSIVLIGLIGVVLLGSGKIQSGTLMILTAFLLVVPVKRHRLPLWVRIALICALFVAVAFNISSTEIPDPSMMTCGPELAFTPTSTGFDLLDKSTYLFSTFLAQAAPS